ncbi:MAG: hypothetical protein JWO67_6965 [Streptosporangiaceae bacterium]|nr:hypothetical protein [Streptosporangiaceae bacterium]
MARDALVSTPGKTAGAVEARLREVDRKSTVVAASVAALPSGIVGRNVHPGSPPATAATTAATAQPVLVASAPVRNGHVYVISARYAIRNTVASTAEAWLRYTTDGSTPTTSSAALDTADHQIPAGSIPASGGMDATYEPTADGTVSVGLSYFAAVGGGTQTMIGGAGRPIELWITDMGPDPGAAGTTY